ncbi:MAG: metal ABC transporter permease [Bdellovibrionaceae bacterium]|nr:metal ABC transporter permease [Pseudobdellovibrionaceae bacterium]
MWSLLVEPFLEYEFLRRALIEAIVLGLGFSIVGQVLITRRLSLIGDTLSHAMLPGVVVAFLLFGANAMALFWGGWITGFLILSASWFLFHRRRVEADAGLALFAVFSVSLGVLLAARTRTTTEILHLLFGNVLAIDQWILSMSVLVAAVTWMVFLWNYRSVLMALVDPVFFESVRPSSWWRVAFLLAIFSANLTVGFASLGAMMTVGLLIVPPLVGRALGRSLFGMVGYSALFSVLVSWVGVLISFHGEVPSGPAIVAVACAGLFLLQFLRLFRRARRVTA